MSVIKDTATVTLNVNGTQAKQMMSELETKIKDTEKTIDELKNKIKDPKALEEARKQLADYQNRLSDLMTKSAETKAAIKDMKAAGASTDEINAAKSQLKKYSTEIGHLKVAVKNTQAELNKFEPKTLEKAKRDLKSYKNQLDEMKSASEGVNKALGNLDTATPRQLEKALRTLNRQLKDMTPGTAVWSSHTAKIKELKERLSELKDEVSEQESLWSRFKKWAFDAWPAIDLLHQWGGSVFDIMRGSVDAFAEMDQEMANVRKFTGMTADQVDDLNNTFKEFDTRTPREGLNKLAQEAGRLGKTSKEDVLGFVRAADQINVSLDDLGEGATLTLSKLTGVFGDEERYGTEQSLLKVGSVINELSQNCSASAPYLTQFASRMGGVGAQAKMTVSQIMAFGAVLDSNGQQVEASSTALSQVIVRMMQEPAKYARVAGLDVKKFTKMLKTDVNGALLLFLETLQKAGGMDTLSPMFKDMGENGARAIAALSTLATHIDQVKEQQRIANIAFTEGTSISKEFAVQNTTVQASLEKAKNAANELRVELGERLSPLMSHLISSSSAAIRALVTLIRFIMDNKSSIVSIAAGIAAYNIVINLAALKTAALSAEIKILNTLMAAQRLGLVAASGVVALLTGNVTKATAAFKLFSMTIKTSPIGLAVSIITTAAVAIGSWISKVREARKAELELARQRETQTREFRKNISDISTAAGDYAKKELERLNKLYSATQDHSRSQKERLAAVKELQKTYPTAFGNLSQEKILAGEAAAAYDNLAINIRKAARAKAAAEKVQDNEKMLLELENEREDLEQSILNDSAALDKAMEKRRKLTSRVSSKNKLSLSGPTSRERRQLADASTAVQILNDNLDASSERLEEIILQADELNKANNKLAKVAGDPSKIAPDIDFSNPEITTTTGTGYISQTQADKEKRKQEAEARRAAAKAKKEFKAELDSYKAQRSAADRQVLELYKSGSIEYDELLRRRHENELKYYDDSLLHFEKTFSEQKETYLRDDKDYQKLLLEREKSDEKYEQSRVTLALQTISRRQKIEEQDAQHMFNVKSDPSVQDEIALQAELYNIRRSALNDKLELYTQGSKEYADIQYEIEALEQNRELTLKQTYFKAVSTLRSEYDKKNAAEKFELEKATLDALLKANILTAEQYAKFLKALSEKYKKDLPGSSKKGEQEQEKSKYDKNVQLLKDALEAQIVSQEEFNERMASLDKERRENMLVGLKETGGEWNSMLVDIYSSFTTLFDSLDGSTQTVLSNIANCTAAISAAVGTGMQIATEYARAESEIQIASIERRYDKEIELAQGNSYKVAKLEKKKEAEIAKTKNDASKKQYDMQIIQAIAQSLTAGLNAYASTMAIPVIGPTIAPAAMAVALAMGATQVTLLKKQQQAAEAQGYAEGGFTKPGRKYEPAGIVHAGEWVASQKLLANPVARPMIEALDYAQRTNTVGSLRPDDVSRAITANNSLVRIAESDGSSALMVAAAVQMSHTVDNLTDRLNEPFITVNTVTGKYGYKQAEDEYTRLMNNITPKRYKK